MSHMNWKPLLEHHRRRLDLHTHLLQQHRPDFLASLGNLREYTHHLEIIEEDGNLIGARSNTQAGIRTLLPQEQGSILVQQQRSAIHGPFERGARWLILSGIGIGQSLLMALPMLDKFPSAGVLAWEPDPYAWTAFFALFDARHVIENTDRLFLFAGDTIHEQTISFLRERRLFLFPPEKTAYLLGALPVAPQYTERYIEQAKSLAKYLNAESARYEPVLSSFMGRAKAPLTSLPRSAWGCAMGRAYIHFPLARAFMEGFARRGLSTHLEPFDASFGRSFAALGSLFETSPDLLFSLNIWPSALLYDLGLPLETIESMTAPRVCWMVDDTLLYEDSGPAGQPGERDFIFYCDRTYQKRLQEFPCHTAYLPPATLFNRPGNPREEYAADISYVGSLPPVQGILHALSPMCIEILERVERQRRQDPTVSFRAILDRLQPSSEQRKFIEEAAATFCRTTNKGFTQSEAELEYFLYNTATYFKRLKTAEVFLPLGIRIFGPPSWRDALPMEYRSRYGGFIDFQNLADCYASSKICLNVHSHQCPTCLNVRDFDIPMAGSVALGDWVEDAEHGLLESGTEFLTYRTVEEGVELARRYLNDCDAREAIRRRGQERVIREHTYERRAETVLAAIAENLSPPS